VKAGDQKHAAKYRQIVTDNQRIWTFAKRPPGLNPPAGAVAAGVPNGRVVLLPSAGHMLTLERPAELASAITEK
jgi:pimeloyl-ACP methyl ester carboxylesterase